MTATTETTQVRRGLAGVYADTTAISMVNQATNSLTYRGYPVQELTRRCSFEEVAYLLWRGELPTPAQLAAQNSAERAQRALDPGVVSVLRNLRAAGDPEDRGAAEQHAEARRARHPQLPAGGHQRRLTGHARWPEPARRHQLLTS